MANSKMNQEFYNRMRNGVKSEKEQAEHAQKARQSIAKHKYGGMALRQDKQEGR